MDLSLSLSSTNPNGALAPQWFTISESVYLIWTLGYERTIRGQEHMREEVKAAWLLIKKRETIYIGDYPRISPIRHCSAPDFIFAITECNLIRLFASGRRGCSQDLQVDVTRWMYENRWAYIGWEGCFDWPNLISEGHMILPLPLRIGVITVSPKTEVLTYRGDHVDER